MEEKKVTEWEELSSGDIWKPEKKGETLIGTIIFYEKDPEMGDFWVILDKNNDEFRTPSHIILQKKMRKVIKGDVVRLTFEGEEAPKLKGRSPTKLYKVERVKN